MGDNPTILYAGRIGLGIDKSLITIARAVDMVNQELNTQLKFVIQAQDVPGWIKRYKNVECRGFVNYEDLPRVFAEADLLVLPYDFSPQSIKYIKFSMPTKAPEYMASGTPIIIFAPEDTALVQYAKAHKWAEVVTEDNLDKLGESIQRMILDETVRTKIAGRAKDVSEARHDVEVVAKDFQRAILSVIEKREVYK
jgi:glycosyltransferase involved in cell wall biosynthesis